MDLDMNCACGTSVQAMDIEPATAELLIENFEARHPHTEERVARLSSQEITERADDQ